MLQGTLTYDNASTVTYDPDTDYTGTTSFLYRADDQQVDLSGVLQNNLSNWGEYRITWTGIPFRKKNTGLKYGF